MHHNDAFPQIDTTFNQNLNTYLSSDRGIYLAELGVYMFSDQLKMFF
jgi:hypothetical protein